MFVDLNYPFVVIPLSYHVDALEPCLDRDNLCIHHDVIYRKYVERLNFILSKYPAYQTWNLEELIFNQNLLPSNIRNDVVKNAGGVYNHQIYFYSLSKNKPMLPNYAILRAIENTYGSFSSFINELYKVALAVFGSGYVWIVSDEKGIISIIPTQNQDTTVLLNLCPIIGIDLWEHAYFLKYHANREQYITNILQIINWEYANLEYIECLKQSEKAKNAKKEPNSI